VAGDSDTAKQKAELRLFYALHSICFAVERYELQDIVNDLVDDRTGRGVFDSALIALDEWTLNRAAADASSIQELAISLAKETTPAEA
jgi:hypothetical protein